MNKKGKGKSATRATSNGSQTAVKVAAAKVTG